VATNAKLLFKVNVGAAVLGLGYIIGLKYSFIICCGSFLVWFIIIPLMNLIFGDSVIDLMGSGLTATVGSMSPEEIFTATSASAASPQPASSASSSQPASSSPLSVWPARSSAARKPAQRPRRHAPREIFR
jgi:hypothetical protein